MKQHKICIDSTGHVTVVLVNAERALSRFCIARIVKFTINLRIYILGYTFTKAYVDSGAGAKQHAGASIKPKVN